MHSRRVPKSHLPTWDTGGVTPLSTLHLPQHSYTSHITPCIFHTSHCTSHTLSAPPISHHAPPTAPCTSPQHRSLHTCTPAQHSRSPSVPPCCSDGNSSGRPVRYRVSDTGLSGTGCQIQACQIQSAVCGLIQSGIVRYSLTCVRYSL